MDASEFEDGIRAIANEHHIDADRAVRLLLPRMGELLDADNFDALEQAVLDTGGGDDSTADKPPATTAAPNVPTPAPADGSASSAAPGGAQKAIFPVAGGAFDPKKVTTHNGDKQVRSRNYAGDDVPEVHTGIDYAVPNGTVIVAPEHGTVVNAREAGAYGNLLTFLGDSGTEYRFAHLSKFDTEPGTVLGQGAALARSGGIRGAPGSGNSTGAHVHIETRTKDGQIVDPEPLFAGAQSVTPSDAAPSKVQQQYDDAVARHDTAATALEAATARRDTLRDKMANGTPSAAEALEYGTIEKDIARLSTDERSAFSQVTSLAKSLQAEGKAPTLITRSLPRGGILQINPLTGEQRTVRAQDAPAAKAPQRFQGPDGREYVMSEDGTSATAVSGVGAPVKTVTAGNRQYPVDAATGLAKTGQGVDLLPELERQAADAKARAELSQSQYTSGRTDLRQKLQPLVDAGAMTGDQAGKQIADYDKLWESAADRSLREYRDAQQKLSEQQFEETRKQNESGNMRSLLQLENQRQQSATAAQGEYDQYGVGSPQRYQRLQDMFKPLDASTAAAAVGKSADDPQFQRAWQAFQQLGQRPPAGSPSAASQAPPALSMPFTAPSAPAGSPPAAAADDPTLRLPPFSASA